MGTKNNPGPFDCYANADADEPMFILLGRDAHAPQLVMAWAGLRETAGEEPRKVAEALRCAADMIEYRERRRRVTKGLAAMICFDAVIPPGTLAEVRGGGGDVIAKFTPQQLFVPSNTGAEIWLIDILICGKSQILMTPGAGIPTRMFFENATPINLRLDEAPTAADVVLLIENRGIAEEHFRAGFRGRVPLPEGWEKRHEGDLTFGMPEVEK